jgi:LPXTG-motif cell wall-anchored protein
MGSVQVTKILEGDRKAVEQAQDLVFEVLVTCQIEVPDPENEGETLLADIYSGVVKIKGGQTKYLVDENDLPRGLPLGAKCFGEEVNTGGANQAVVDLDSWENSAEVTSGDPSELQLLTITAKNTFEDPPCTRDCLPITGAQMGGGALIGLGLLLAGVLFLIRRRRRTGHPDRPMTG